MHVEPAKLDDAAVVAAGARAADVAELWAANRETPEEALAQGLAVSIAAWTVWTDRPVAIAGVASISALGERGIPWMIATDGVRENVRQFLALSRGYVGEMRRMYPVLKNRVDARNKVSVRYLRAIGFTIEEPEPFGPDGLLFHPFGVSIDV